MTGTSGQRWRTIFVAAGQGDVAGADIVMTWITGYPFSVNLARGYPRYNPGEFSAQDMLERNIRDGQRRAGAYDGQRVGVLLRIGR